MIFNSVGLEHVASLQYFPSLIDILVFGCTHRHCYIAVTVIKPT